ncbi:hypothetical protein [Dactylosporangium sp. NPDC048998]|uniref:hypothetical protein n=1 Tax=Dactylosporangium sp. NPDC048998 TaxID=3363976 RepID=UPI00371A6F1B
MSRLERDVAVVERTGGWINRAVWGIAFGVMVYGAVNVTPLLIEHGVLRWTAPGLPLMVDLAMCIGLWGDRVMHQYGRTAGWVTALRWITATMTLALNIAGPVLGLDWVGLGIHACGPLLILVVAEAAGSFQRLFAEIVTELRAEIDRQRSTLAMDTAGGVSTVAVVPAQPGPLGGGESAAPQPTHDARDQGLGGVASEPAVLGAAAGSTATTSTGVGRLDGEQTPDRDPVSAAGLEKARQTRRDETPAGTLAGQFGALVDAADLSETVSRNETPLPTRPESGRGEETGPAHERPEETPAGPLAGQLSALVDTADVSEAVSRDETPLLTRPELRRDESREHETGPTRERRGETGRSLGRSRDETRRDGGPGSQAAPDHAVAPLTAGSRAPDGDAQSTMWSHFQQCRAAGIPVTGADLDRVAGTNNYASRVMRSWIEAGLITEQDRDDARAGRGTAAASDVEPAVSERGGQEKRGESPLRVSISSMAGVGGAG